jgi:tetratricopeptide (TPR) repeat protein
MISCILLLYIAGTHGSAAADFRLKAEATNRHTSGDFHLQVEAPQKEAPRAEAPRAQAEDPDALYAHRNDLGSAKAAERIWADRLQNKPDDFESAWKLSRARYWLGGHASEADRKELFEQGITAARAAIAAAPQRPEGHFWAAANMGALAESFGLRQGIKYRGQIKDELETVLKIDPGFQQGSADRALGRWYFKVPGLFGGSMKKSEEHLRQSLTYNPNSTASLYFLAETLLEEKKTDEARATLEKVLAVPVDPAWAPEDNEFKAKARDMLTHKTLRRSGASSDLLASCEHSHRATSASS